MTKIYVQKIEENVGKYFEWDGLAEEKPIFCSFFLLCRVIIFIMFIIGYNVWQLLEVRLSLD